MLLEALEDWNPWWSEGEVSEDLKGITRDILSTALEYVELSKVKVVTGIRRCGKSTLLYQIIDSILTGEDACNVLLLNFDDVRLASTPIEEIYRMYLEELRPTNVYLFLDEVHGASGWVSLVRRVTDLGKAKVFVTDSSSYFIPLDYARVLTGRKISLELYPLSFREFLRFKGVVERAAGTEGHAILRGHLKEYMVKGGFPEPFFHSEKTARRILLEYFEDIVARDVVSRFGANYGKVRDLAYYLISNTSQMVTYRKLRGILGLGLETVQNYVNYLESVYLIFRVPAFSEKVKSQLMLPKKVYAVDTGLVNTVGFKISENIGAILENIVFLELKRRGYDIYYLPTEKREVDFVAKRGSEVRLINVCYDPSDTNTFRREVEGLIEGLRAIGLARGEIVTWSYKDKVRVNNKEVFFTPATEWLLSS
ncbi:MAG: ATP-binding protein [Candidatus Freyarchaeota archaeon]|nr:ATP-binding protein [Candidatus Freyrarchaeum guaymaensis]